MRSSAEIKILFITPGTTSAGGNIFLLRFLRWFKRNSAIPFITLYGYGGDQEEEFAKLSGIIRYDEPESQGLLGRSRKKLSEHFGIRRRRIASRIRSENIGLIYSNTVITDRMLSMFYDLEIPIITHCHELDSVMHLAGVDGARNVIRHSKHIIAVSESVRQNLIENHQVAFGDVSLIHGFVPVETFSDEELKGKREAVCRELGIPENAFIVGASGTLEWRKGPDIFIQVARQLFDRNKELPVFFVWVGGGKKGDFETFKAKHDVEKLGLQNKVLFLGHKSNPLDYYAALDVFAMVSRDEPFGLVVLESASLGKPVICFENAGGAPELVGDDGGFVVPYLDTEAFAEKIVMVRNDPELRKKFGRNISERVRADHDLKNSAPKIAQVIERFISRN